MFSKILIANRGEIALRITRSCRELGIKTVAVYSEADRASLHLKLADETVCIGPPDSRKSYLNADSIFKAAHETGVKAIHPGYGYLAESETFAQGCLDRGFAFIGPTPQNLKVAGDKVVAREMMKNAGVPVILGSPGPLGSIEEAGIESERIGYPVMLKSAGGGGGRGIRICDDEEALVEEYPIAGMEARASFGNDQLYLEKFIQKPRHIEFQILADKDGNTIHLGERECTIQRRFQKLVEESPSPFLTSGLREEMGNSAVAAARAFGYFNAGTVEFLVDENGDFYFMEMNARIQVEHPITELTTGLDLIKEQIRLTAGERLHAPSIPSGPKGWAIECRINAEDPDRNFAPCPGTIKEYHPPGGFGVRLDTHLYQGYELPIYYDSLLAKLISHDQTREGAIRIMKRALEEFRIGPVKTTIPLHLKIMEDPVFLSGDLHTDFIKRIVPEEEEEDE